MPAEIYTGASGLQIEIPSQGESPSDQVAILRSALKALADAPSPTFGSSVTDLTPTSDTWKHTHQYRNLTIGAGVTIQADHMGFGPLIIKCSGTLLIQSGGVLCSDGKGIKFAGSWVGNGAAESNWNTGHSSLSGTSWGDDTVENWSVSGLMPIGLGGAGGWGDAENGGNAYPGWGGAKEFQGGSFEAYQVLGGSVEGQNGESKGHHSGVDPADYILSVLSIVGVGGGGATGGKTGIVMRASGGNSGGSIIIIARQVIVDAGGIIQANGLPGANATQGDAGGAGGGSGGYIGIHTGKYTNDGTVQVLGGAGGTGFGTGGDGGAGSVGCIKVEKSA